MEPEGGPAGPLGKPTKPGAGPMNLIRASRLQENLAVVSISDLVTASKRLDVEEVQRHIMYRKDITQYEKNAALHKSAEAEDDDEERSIQIISLLLENGAQVNSVEEQHTFPTHRTALHNAAYRLKKNTISLLIKKGADVNLKSAKKAKGETALQQAVKAPDLFEFRTMECVKRLVESKADIDATDTKGHTALHSAVSKEKKRTFVQLLNHGADGMKASTNDWTGLTISLYWNMLDEAKLILNSPKYTPDNINLKNEEGETALGYATAYGMTDIVPLLLKKGASPYKNKDIYDFSEQDLEKYLDSCINFENKMKKISESSLQLDYKFFKTSGVSDNADNKGAIIDIPTFKSQDNGQTGRQEDSTEMVDIPVVTSVDSTQFTDIPELETTILEDIAKQHKKLLKHPMITIFLMLKYSRVKFLYNIWIAMKIGFLCLLVALVMQNYSPDVPNEARCSIILNEETQDDNTTANTITNTTQNLQEESVPQNLLLLVPFSALLAVFILMEVLQCLISVSAWVWEPKNWLQISILATCSHITWCLLTPDGSPGKVSKQVVAFLLPMAYYEFLHELGTFPRLSKYVLLFKSISLKFIKYTMVYIGLVIMCAFSYIVMLPQKPNDNSEIDNPERLRDAVLHIIVMFIGEVSVPNFDRDLYTIQAVFFLGFVFFLVIVLMSLLNALAVANAREMLEIADMEMLRGLLVTVAFWENLANGDPKHRFSWSALPLMRLTKLCWWPNPKFLNVLPGEAKLCFSPFRKSKKEDGVKGVMSSVMELLVIMGLSHRKVSVENSKTYFNWEMKVDRRMIKSAIRKIKSEEADTSEKVTNKLEGLEKLQDKMMKKWEQAERQNNWSATRNQMDRMEKLMNQIMNQTR